MITADFALMPGNTIAAGPIAARIRLLPTTLRSAVVLVAAALASGCTDTAGIDATSHEPRVLFSDHADIRFNAASDITDLHAFVVDKTLVIAVSTNPAIPATATHYHFPTDVTFDIHIDNDSEVVDDPVDLLDVAFRGGTVVHPDQISEDITFRIRFGEDGAPSIERIVRGKPKHNDKVVRVFAGLRDDPFIRTASTGHNVAAIVLEIPLSHVLWRDPMLLIWATTAIDGVDLPGEHSELAGRAMAGAGFNRLHPSEHLSHPNVMIYDTSRPAAFPSGRALEDDVVDLACLADIDDDGQSEPVGNCRQYQRDVPPASVNDLPFLTAFPFLAAPHTR